MGSNPIISTDIEFQFTARVWEWRGPAPYFFVTVPNDIATELKELSAAVSYGWGMIPVVMQINDFVFETSLFPKEGSYVVPLKKAVRERLAIDLDDEIALTLEPAFPNVH